MIYEGHGVKLSIHKLTPIIMEHKSGHLANVINIILRVWKILIDTVKFLL